MSTKYSALGQMENPEDITLLTFEISNTNTNSNGILLIDYLNKNINKSK